MKPEGRQPVLGIATDEEAMYELLSKFLGKEGYQTKRVSTESSESKDMALVVLAPTREPSRSKSWFENFRMTKPAVLVVQCCDEDYVGLGENVVLLKERPLNLKQLGDAVRSTLRKSAQ